MNRYVCIHGHFYQPPRENAWLEDVELQDSAYPYHDWNERITAEGYAPNTASRILDSESKIIDIVNNYSKISFNFGPTLFSWMEKEMPEVYEAIIEADRESQKNFSGHGSAIAQVYNHMIMPLANSRDKRTQIHWGIKDFERRFGRKPEGMWLSETAVDLESLDILAEYGIKFTILAPRQASRVCKIGEEGWHDVSGDKVDPKMPYLCKLPSGKTIALFFYDGPISQELGFGDLLNNGEEFAGRLMQGFVENEHDDQLVHIATDGETYGHHKPHGEMALAYCLYHIESNDLANITIYSEYLENVAPTHEVEIFENSSWSCVHGVERWRSDCGCNSGRSDWHQAWRAPLREALDWLREELIPLYEKEMASLVKDPWQARDNYIEVIFDRAPENVERFLNEHAARDLTPGEKIKTLRLLELQRHAMLMYTSCGWFFDEISGIETTQVMQYAARAMQLAEEVGRSSLEMTFIEKLAKAPSNIPEHENGADVYEKFIKPARIDLLRVGAHYAVSSLFEEYPESIKIYCYTTDSETYDKMTAGRLKLAVGKAQVRSDITWNETEVTFAVLHLGGHILNGGVREFMGDEALDTLHHEIKEAFLKSDVPEVIRIMDDHFGMHNYSLWYLFKDEQRKVFDQILESTLEEAEVHFRGIYENDYAVMQAMREMHIPIPRALRTPLEFVLNTDLRNLLQNDEPNLEQLQNLVQEFKKWHVVPDKTTLNFVASKRVNELLKTLSQSPYELERIEFIRDMIRLLKQLGLELDFWEAQNIYFLMGTDHFDKMKTRAGADDKEAVEWVEQFQKLGDHLQVRII
ncbi:DUF3536 domain-containing protein [candidate division KSB1 bacterium]|nr:DUF3536 domain-containing protein [candidate division KSB1 bacterium]NIR72233.1 DUF3536 domain-containing protein [candidate division KSB1 bacterium]NIS26299.1 DUF3536 domain-containing protein [candidate division KSB1 bacterium]NIT73062.1 DUF3536 domain-containing protein [candidate division KSB1 bacterium]NIU26969.1 DUF3536 domain-containing protein [candidate division KSB1 bacterium]